MTPALKEIPGSQITKYSKPAIVELPKKPAER
jgi:hypothetical protein